MGDCFEQLVGKELKKNEGKEDKEKMRTQRTRKNAGAERASSSLRRNIEKIERDKTDLKILLFT